MPMESVFADNNTVGDSKETFRPSAQGICTANRYAIEKPNILFL